MQHKILWFGHIILYYQYVFYEKTTFLIVCLCHNLLQKYSNVKYLKSFLLSLILKLQKKLYLHGYLLVYKDSISSHLTYFVILVRSFQWSRCSAATIPCNFYKLSYGLKNLFNDNLKYIALSFRIISEYCGRWLYYSRRSQLKIKKKYFVN